MDAESSTVQSTQSGGKELPTGTRLEEFVIERVLGSGGFGITYLARDTSLNRQVVIKENLPAQFAHRDTTSLTVHPGPGHEDQENFRWSLENFSREGEMLASLRHPGIVPVLRRFDAFGTAYFVMPFVEGVPLDQLIEERLRESKPFSEQELRGLLEHVLAALDHLHQRGIYHRDIKPGNLLITNDGIPVLIDFGSARQRLSERSMTVVESAGYTPFEQLQSRGNVGPWSDLYALAATLVKVMTGEAPPKTNDRTMGDPWRPLARRAELIGRYSPELLATLDQSLRLPVEERWQDADGWKAALKQRIRPMKDNLSLLDSDASPSPKATEELAASEPDGFVWINAIFGILVLSVIGIWIFSSQKSDPISSRASTPVVTKAPPAVQDAEPTPLRDPPSTDAQTAPENQRSRTMPEPARQAGTPFEGNRAGEEREFEIAPGVNLTMCWIPPGEFMMGSPASEQGREKDETQHRVKIPRGFWMAKTETTQAQWSSIRERNPSNFWSNEQPVERVSWNDICGNETRDGGFLGKVNAHASSGCRFDLPTEAEWEYACRAGSSQSMTRNSDLSEMGWYATNSENRTHPVAGKKANAWGLYDMHGNVWEWCADWYGAYPSGTLSDPRGSPSGSERVFRGGGWFFHANRCRAASRAKCRADYRDDNLGFRLVLRPKSKVKPEISKSSGPDDGLIFIDDFARTGNSNDPNLKSNRCFSFQGEKTYDIALKDRLLPTKSGVVLRFKWHAPKPNLIGSSAEGMVMLQFDVYNPNGNRIMYQPEVLSSPEWQEISLEIQVGFDAERILVWNKWEDVEMYIDDLKIVSLPSDGSESLQSERADKVELGDSFAFLQKRIVVATETSSWDFDRIRYAINYLYALKGYPFKGPKEIDLRREFERFVWYKPINEMSMDDADEKMSPIESENIKLLAVERNKKARK
jgi:formylglycine-generating enzyme required for sulfatase activity